MKKTVIILVILAVIAVLLVVMANSNNGKNKKKVVEYGEDLRIVTPDPDRAGLTLPAGFGALKVTELDGKPRHLAVNINGDIYVKMQEPMQGHGIWFLSDRDGDGKTDNKTGFGDYAGTGIFLTKDYLYASSDEAVFRYPVNDEQIVYQPDNPERIVYGLLDREQHKSKSITLDGQGNIYVNIGAYSNSCQEKDRKKGSKGKQPCPILDSAGGIWRFSANKQEQTYGDGTRYATGVRNVVGLDWNEKEDQLYIMHHGRDELHHLFPDLYTEEESSELPAEAMYALEEGDNVGWPYTYYDHLQGKRVLAPEYGGDGNKEGTMEAVNPVMSFPAHLAPNGLLFYTGKMFPERYRNGAFIAFHGSWNRTAGPQKGFFVAFAPFENGKPTGEWEVFADGFAGEEEIDKPKQAKHRPCGLAQGPDGSLFVSDDAGGVIYRIVYE